MINFSNVGRYLENNREEFDGLPKKIEKNQHAFAI